MSLTGCSRLDLVVGYGAPTILGWGPDNQLQFYEFDPHRMPPLDGDAAGIMTSFPMARPRRSDRVRLGASSPLAEGILIAGFLAPICPAGMTRARFSSSRCALSQLLKPSRRPSIVSRLDHTQDVSLQVPRLFIIFFVSYVHQSRCHLLRV